ncbi:MAG: hypothetical protein JEZ08_13065 [Clostridiales bacterium]|nr:hypothetical protein [Clostridiales bacterium]
MKKSNRVISMIIVFVLLFNMIPSFGGNPILEITNAEELIRFSESCTYDVYSRDLIVKLQTDLDLTGVNFIAIPSFSGVFEGNGHTISGLNITLSSSDQGLFRYVEERGVVKNLNVKGFVDPSGTKSEIGGIAGTNRGLIMNCIFEGHVSGTSSIGGIVGLNESSGSILGCMTSGTVTGEHYTGGIVGQNVGYVAACTNHSLVNTTDDAILSNDMDSYDLEELENGDLNSTENIDAQTDTGGITGYNQGILSDNTNYGTIGYQHVGYNIGGVSGRQSGYIESCKNYGAVYGRKDIGGIVGQFEPYIRLLFSEDTLEKLDQEFQVMNELLETAVDEAHQSSNQVSDRLESVNQLMNTASNDLELVLTGTADYADDASETINDAFSRMKKISLQLTYVVDELSLASVETTLAFDALESGFDELKNASDDLADGIGDLENAFYDLELASQDADHALNKIALGLNKIEQATAPSTKYDDGVKLVSEGLGDLEKANSKAQSSITIIREYYDLNGNLIGLDYGPVLTELDSALEHLNVAIPKLNNGFRLLSSEFEDDMALLREAFVWFDSAMTDLKAMSEDLDNMRADIEESLENMQAAAKKTSKAMAFISDGMGYFESGSIHLTKSIEYMTKIIDEQNRNPGLNFPTLSEYVGDNTDQLFDSLSDVSRELTLLNQEARHGSDKFVENLEQINVQYKVIAEIIRDGINALSFDNEAMFEDISDTPLDVTDQQVMERGYLTNCYNEGPIKGDVDVGGIAGAMAIEFDFDPEDEIVKKGESTFNFKYQTKAILSHSINRGDITSKKDYVGGIVGRMDMGLLFSSENYASIQSVDGHYVGGIAGLSDSTIRKSYSISELSGKKYIGGITGLGQNIYDSYALVDILKFTEFAGSIAGDTRDITENNYFVNNKWAGIDGISYGEKATPLSYEAFVQKDIPEAFKSFKLSFIVEDELLLEVPFEYGDTVSIKDIPEVPKKEGYYTNWSEEEYANLRFSKKITAVYTPLIQVLSSDTSIKPQLLVEGVFDPEIKLRMNETTSYKKKNGETILDEWRIAIDKSQSDTMQYRYLRPTSEHEVVLYQMKDDRWEKIVSEEDGSYLVFETKSNNFKLAVIEKQTNHLMYYLSGSLIVLLVLGLLFKNKRAKKKVLIS